MERVSVLNKENDLVTAAKLKGGERMAVEIVPRKGLTDISNLPQNTQVARKSTLIPTDVKQYIEKLKLENLELLKHVLERNKIIEMRGIELQKLSISYQKLLQQNMQLAQANTQMLTDLNSGKDRLKVLQHELGCINGLHQARKLELKDKDKANTLECQANENGVETIKSETVGQLTQTDKVKDKACKTKRKRQSKIQSLAAENDKPIQQIEKGGKKRQSARLKSCEQEPYNSVRGDDALNLATLNSDQADEMVDKQRIQSIRQSARLKSEGQEQTEHLFETSDPLSPASSKGVQAGEKTNDNRNGLRRQSARLRSQESVQEPTRDLDQMDDAKLYISPLPKEPESERCPMPSVSSVKNEPEASDGGGTELKDKAQGHRTSSVRPTRRAAGKIQSYKEIPLNVKMRR